MSHVKINKKVVSALYSDNDYERMMRKFKTFKKKMLSSDSFSRDFFVKTGIYDINGNLTEHYR